MVYIGINTWVFTFVRKYSGRLKVKTIAVLYFVRLRPDTVKTRPKEL